MEKSNLAIDLKLCFKCITPYGGNRLPIHRIHNLRLCNHGDVRRGECIAFGYIKKAIDQSPLSFAKQNKVYYPFKAKPYIAKGDVKIDALPPTEAIDCL